MYYRDEDPFECWGLDVRHRHPPRSLRHWWSCRSRARYRPDAPSRRGKRTFNGDRRALRKTMDGRPGLGVERDVYRKGRPAQRQPLSDVALPRARSPTRCCHVRAAFFVFRLTPIARRTVRLRTRRRSPRTGPFLSRYNSDGCARAHPTNN